MGCQNRLSNRPEDVKLDDWKHLVEYFGSDEFKVVSERNKKNRDKKITKHSCGTKSFAEVEESTRDPLTGEKEIPDKIWEIQHTCKNVNGERGQLHQLFIEQQSEEIENPMTSDEILSSVLGVRSGYVWGKGHGKKPPKKSQMQQENIEANVSSAVESMRQEMQLDMERRLQEEREQMAADLKREMDQDFQKKLEEEREHMKGEVEKIFQEKMVALMAEMQQQDILKQWVDQGGT
ncbi:hypothetical protein P3S68_022179 [Capsicum galapagoense]